MFASYELARHPEIQTVLYKELVAAFPDLGKSLEFAVLEKLPIFNSIY